ncbi:Inositol-pentakisphosphate 2-kinase [Pleurotus pulmonarius]
MAAHQLASVADTLPLEWKYISEGGATAVFSYVGPSDPQFDGMVLRLRKCPLGHPARSAEEMTQEEPDDATVEFQRRCMERLVPPIHLPRMVSVKLNEPWLRAFSEAHNIDRRAERRRVDEIDWSRTKGVLATDLIGTDGLAVEIKPKWGFLPSPKHLTTTTSSVKTHTCRFCMHVHLKVLQGDTDVSVGYCPLDLFSGNPERIKLALESLWSSWMATEGTVNNWKMFVAGMLVRPQTMHDLKVALFGYEPRSIDPDVLRNKCVDLLMPLLTDTPVLRILAKLQRTLDILDIEGLSSLWHRTLVSYADPAAGPDTPLSPVGQTSSLFESPDPTIDDWSDFIDQYLVQIGSSTTKEERMNHAQPLTSNLRYYLMAYLLSATFKDCSIIIKPVMPGTQGKGSITIIDLDPKGMDRLRKWERLDAQIALAYGRIDEASRKTCFDAGVEA